MNLLLQLVNEAVFNAALITPICYAYIGTGTKSIPQSASGPCGWWGLSLSCKHSDLSGTNELNMGLCL